MAFNDIRNWAMILENEELEQKKWDKACDEANAEAEFREEQEFDECGEDVVDPSDYQITEKETEEEIDEEDEFEEAIDFSKYQLDPLQEEDEEDGENVQEADTREILTRIANALEKPAGTANLVGQNVVALNESSEYVQNICKQLKTVLDWSEWKSDTKFKIEIKNQDCIKKNQFVRFEIRNNTLNIKGIHENLHSRRIYETPDTLKELSEKLERAGLKMSKFEDIFITYEGSEFDVKNIYRQRGIIFFVAGKRRGSARLGTRLDVPDSREISPSSIFEDGDCEEPVRESSVIRGKKKISEAKLRRFDRMLREANQYEYADDEPFEDADDVKDEYGYSANDYANMSQEEFMKTLQKLPDEMDDDAKKAVADAYKVAQDYPIDDKGMDLLLSLSLPEQIEVVKGLIGKPGLSKEAVQNLNDDLALMEQELKKKTTEDRLMRRAMFIQNKSFSENGISEDEVKEFAGILDKLDDYQKQILLGLPYKNGFKRIGEIRVFLNPRWLGFNKPGAGKGGGEDDEGDPELAKIDADLAKYGHKFNMDKDSTYVQEPLEPGYYNFEHNFDAVSPTDRLKDAKNMAARLDKEGWIKDYYEKKIKPEIIDKLADRPAEAGVEDIELADEDIVKFYKALLHLPKKVRDKFKQEWLADAKTDGERRMVNDVFSGKAAYPDFKDINAEAGLGYDQQGRTGGGTEWADKHINLRLLMMCEFLNVDAEDCEVMRRYLRMESKAARDARKEIRPRMAEEIFQELDDKDQRAIMAGCGLNGHIPDPNTRTEKDDFNKFVNFMLGVVVSHATRAEKQQLSGMVADFKNNSEVRKWKSGLDNDRNHEYQNLLSKQRDRRDEVTEPERIRLLQLDLMRHGYGEADALRTANEIMAAPDPEALAKVKGVSLNLTKTFLKGQNNTMGVVNRAVKK